MKQKSVGFAQEFLMAETNCVHCLLGLDFMIDQECMLNLGEKLLCSTKNWTALPISAQTTTGVRTFAIAERNARIPCRQAKLAEIVIKYGNGTILSSPEGLIECIQ